MDIMIILKKLVKMINDDPNLRPTAKEVYDELLSIEVSINNKINVNTQIIKIFYFLYIFD